MSDLKEALHTVKLAKMRSAIEKNAAFWTNFNKALGGAMLSAGSAAAVTAAGALAGEGFSAIRERIEKPKAFKSMMENMPGLKKEDPKAVQMTFNTLYGMNRKMAKDPLVAGSFVSRNVQRADMGGEGGAYIDPQTVKLLRDAGSAKGEPASPIMSAWERGAASSAELGQGKLLPIPTQHMLYQQQYERGGGRRGRG